ncbi:MAG: SDR family oxidoreductase [Woeseiaceae bacterium]|nr:SDR family oxidoreductase [Woeseiaceae bacterium]
MRQFQDKKVLVTGGSRGIGKSIARAFADQGARVAINYRSNAAAAADCLRELGGKGNIALQADIADPAQAAMLVEDAISGLGGLDIVVNNAGIYLWHPIATADFSDWIAAWRQTIDTNLLAAASICYCAAQHMMRHGGGRIVNVSSRGAFRGEPDGPAYGASKAGLNALSQSLAIALAPHNIFVGVVAPGFVETDMAAEWLEGERGDAIRAQSPLGRVARPEEVAHAVLFLASPGAEFTTGTIIDVNGASYLRS